MTHKDKYHQLSRGKQRTFRERFIDFFSCDRATFYRKVAGTVPVRRSEKLFFEQHLNPDAQ